MTGLPLEWDVVDGAEARATRSSPGQLWKAATSGWPWPTRCRREVRPGSGSTRPTGTTRATFQDGDDIVFDRSLGIKRNAVVLPAGYELVEVNHPSQVQVEADGRIRVSFLNTGAAAVPYRVTARPLPPFGDSTHIGSPTHPLRSSGGSPCQRPRPGRCGEGRTHLLRAGLPGPGDRLLPPGPGLPLIPSLPRLYGDPARVWTGTSTSSGPDPRPPIRKPTFWIRANAWRWRR